MGRRGSLLHVRAHEGELRDQATPKQDDVEAEVYGVFAETRALSGQLVLTRKGAAATGGVSRGERALLMGVGGDALLSLSAQREGWQTARPLALRVLADILAAAKKRHGSDEFQVSHLRIHSMSRSTFLAALQVGQLEPIDCRPSDGMWIAMEHGAPIYVARSVWEESAVSAEDVGAPGTGLSRAKAAAEQNREEEEDKDERWDIMPGDPEPIKRLKRELAVALQEEDYDQAARLRDHEYLSLYLQAVKAGEAGDERVKADLLAELRRRIEENEQSSQDQLPPGEGSSS